MNLINKIHDLLITGFITEFAILTKDTKKLTTAKKFKAFAQFKMLMLFFILLIIFICIERFFIPEGQHLFVLIAAYYYLFKVWQKVKADGIL